MRDLFIAWDSEQSARPIVGAPSIFAEEHVMGIKSTRKDGKKIRKSY